MEFGEFEELLQVVRAGRSEAGFPEEIELFDSWLATEPDIQHTETELGIRLPEKYKAFMKCFGGGEFLFLDLLPVVSPDGHVEDLVEVNRTQFRGTGFVAISPVGTGDWWGFSLVSGICGETVDFWDHEGGGITPSSVDFLEFLAEKGLRAGA